MIIAITGTHGAGKGTLIQFFKEKGFITFSMSGFIMEEVRKRNLPEVRDSTRLVANELRQNFGPEYIARQRYEAAIASGKNAVIEALRCPGEADFLLNAGARLIGIDADSHIRYERIHKRGNEMDRTSFEQFIFEEKRESTGTEPWDMNIPLCLAKAEKIFMNNGDLETLLRKIDTWLQRIDFKK